MSASLRRVPRAICCGRRRRWCWSRVARGQGLDAARGRRCDAGRPTSAAPARSAAAGSNGRRSAQARELLARRRPRQSRSSMPLGPGLGQCCGGHVDAAADAGQAPRSSPGLRPPRRAAHGAPAAGAAVRRRPCRPRAGAGAGAPAAARCAGSTAVPTSSRDRAAAGRRGRGHRPAARRDRAAPRPVAPALVLTHSHALDFTLCSAVLRARRLRLSRPDRLARPSAPSSSAASRELGIPAERIARLACPIGGAALRDKRPAVIAALAAAELSAGAWPARTTQAARERRARKGPHEHDRRTGPRRCAWSCAGSPSGSRAWSPTPTSASPSRRARSTRCSARTAPARPRW